MDLRNWRQQKRHWKRNMIPRTRKRRRTRCQRKQKRQRARENVSGGRSGGVFTVPGNWRPQRWHLCRKMGPRSQWWRQMRRRRTRNIWRVRGIGKNGGYSGGSTTVPKNLQQRRRRRQRNTRTNNTAKITEASTENRTHVQGTGDNNRGGSGLTTGLMDWKWQGSVNFHCYRVSKGNIVSPLYRCCLVLILFSSESFIFCSLKEILSVLQSCGWYFCTNCTLTLRMYPLRTGE